MDLKIVVQWLIWIIPILAILTTIFRAGKTRGSVTEAKMSLQLSLTGPGMIVFLTLFGAIFVFASWSGIDGWATWLAALVWAVQLMYWFVVLITNYIQSST